MARPKEIPAPEGKRTSLQAGSHAFLLTMTKVLLGESKPKSKKTGLRRNGSRMNPPTKRFESKAIGTAQKQRSRTSWMRKKPASAIKKRPRSSANKPTISVG